MDNKLLAVIITMYAYNVAGPICVQYETIDIHSERAMERERKSMLI